MPVAALADGLLVIGSGDAGDEALRLDTLPPSDAVDAALLSARLMSRPVTVLPGATQYPSVIALTASYSPVGGSELVIGGETFDIDVALGTTSALSSRDGGVLLMSLADSDAALVTTAPAIGEAAAELGFGLVAVSATAEGNCDLAALARDLAHGVADVAPFGNGDDVTTGAEARAYLDTALSRQTRRGASCAPVFSVLHVAAEDAPLLTHDPARPVPSPDLVTESFEARVLSRSNDLARIDEFLATCSYCPAEAALIERRDRVARQEAMTDVETGIWDRIKDDTTPERITAYLETCTFCLFRTEAEARVARLGTGDSVRPALETEPGVHADRAEAGILDDTEAEALERALASDDPLLIQAYLDSCVTCDGKDRLTEALRRAHHREALLQPCLLGAGVPQMGGPRQLTEIDGATAAAACAAVLDSFPDTILARVMLGRTAQAAGDLAAAEAAYDAGMRAGLPAAYGLAAHMLYSPDTPGAKDLDKIERLALEGAKRGDWMSKEVLSVLYTKEELPGRSHADAFRFAMEAAGEGNTLAQFFVGYYYLEGMGAPKDVEQAAYWFDKAVRLGYLPANTYLAGLLEEGLGIAPEPKRAAALYWAAFMQGDDMARARLVDQLSRRDQDVIRYVQTKLKDEQVYFGQVDGIVGRGTQRAIETLALRLGGAN